MDTCSNKLFPESLAGALLFNEAFLSLVNMQGKENVCDVAYIEMAVYNLNYTQNHYFQN